MTPLHLPVAFGLGWMEITVILIFALLIFGKRLPEVMRSAGKGIVEFKRGMRDIEDDIEETSRIDPPPEKKPLTEKKSPVQDYVPPDV